MPFNFSFNVEYLIQTSVNNHNASTNSSSFLATSHISENLVVKLYPRWYKHIAVEWSVPADWGNCLFNVYFSQTENGPFELTNPTPISGTYLLDTETQEYRRFNNGYYVVEAILLDQSNVSIRSEAVSWTTYQRKWVEIRSLEVQRREYILLSKFVGVKTYVFRAKTYGERCPECWNKSSEKSIKDNCKTCFGTTFKGGYFQGAPTYFQYEPTANQLMRTYFGLFEPNQIGAWTISVPELHVDDIVIRTGDWSLYRIDKLADTELQSKTVRQIAQLTQLPKNSVQYELLTKNIPEYPNEYL